MKHGPDPIPPHTTPEEIAAIPNGPLYDRLVELDAGDNLGDLIGMGVIPDPLCGCGNDVDDDGEGGHILTRRCFWDDRAAIEARVDARWEQ